MGCQRSLACYIIRTRRVTPLHLAARMGHLSIIQVFRRYGIALNALEGENQSILAYAKIGLEEFKDNYEFHLRGEYSSEAVNENSKLSEELARKKLNDIDWNIGSLMIKNGHPEVRLSQYQALVNYLVPLFETAQSISTLTRGLGAMNMSQSTPIPATNELNRKKRAKFLDHFFEKLRANSQSIYVKIPITIQPGTAMIVT